MDMREHRRKDLENINAMIYQSMKPAKVCCGCGQSLNTGVKGSLAVTSSRDICFECKFGDEP